MGDGGWRRVDAAAARHILTRVGLSAFSGGGARGAAGDSRPHTKGRRFVGAALPFTIRSVLVASARPEAARRAKIFRCRDLAAHPDLIVLEPEPERQ